MNQRAIFLFRKYIKNECTSEELDELLEALKDSKNNSQFDLITRTLWQTISKQPGKMPTETERKLLQTEANKLLTQAESTKVRYPFFRKSVYTRIMSVAAVAAVLVVIGTIHFTRLSNNIPDNTVLAMSDFKHFNTDDKATRQISLPDGSYIHLNKNTELRMVENQFNRKNREVWLSGEAFFEVAKNPEKPFIIHTGTMKTTVRGTSFNVKAYPQLVDNVVSVRTGKVEVTTQNKVLAMLTPGKQITYNVTNGSSETQDVNTSDIAAWTDGRLVLNNAGIDELKLRLKQQFGANLQVNGQILNTVKLNAVFYKNTRLEDAMETISVLYGIHYEITKSRNVIINN